MASTADSYVIPETYLPAPARTGPYLESAREAAKEWARRMGMWRPDDATRGPDQEYAWTEREWDASDLAWASALMYPDADEQESELLAQWFAGLLFIDDVIEDGFAASGDLPGAAALADRLCALMPEYPAMTPLPASAAEKGLADLWLRTAPSMPPTWRHRFANDVENMIRGRLLMAYRQVSTRTPDLLDYITSRRQTSGMYPNMDLIEHAAGREIPHRLFRSLPVQMLRDAANDHTSLINDLVSLPKEDPVNNGTAVIRDFLECDTQAAAVKVDQLMTQRVKTLLQVTEHDLPAYLDHEDVDERTRRTVLDYADSVRDMLIGSATWHLAAARYSGTGRQSQRTRPLGPSGLGTSAARILIGR